MPVCQVSVLWSSEVEQCQYWRKTGISKIRCFLLSQVLFTDLWGVEKKKKGGGENKDYLNILVTEICFK